jgi:uncharacterized protein YbjQ (UPF0145 family)
MNNPNIKPKRKFIMLVVSTDSIPGKKIIQVIGLVFGHPKNSPDYGLIQNLKATHEVLIVRNIEKNAAECGANAVVGFRCMVGGSGNLTKISGYGTAVIIEDEA